MEVTLLYPIKSGSKTTRWLVSTLEEDYHSIIRDSNENDYYVGKKISVQENDFLGTDIQIESWKEKYFSYRESVSGILNHLLEYKRNNSILNQLEWGIWKDKKREHILPYRKNNLINCGYFNELCDLLIKYESYIHQGFSHLNSSQAFAFNLFGPLSDNELLEIIQNIKDQNSKPISKDTSIKNSKFEETITDFDIDGLREYSQFDFFINLTTTKITFEIKYSEDAFGKAKYEDKEETYEEKYLKIYEPKLKELLTKYPSDFKEQFFEEYQLWRNILYSLISGFQICFLFPKFRRDLEKKVIEAITKIKPEYQSKIHIIYADDIVQEAKKLSQKLKEHYDEFEKKYLY